MYVVDRLTFAPTLILDDTLATAVLTRVGVIKVLTELLPNVALLIAVNVLVEKVTDVAVLRVAWVAVM
jgi:hypothetical protein